MYEHGPAERLTAPGSRVGFAERDASYSAVSTAAHADGALCEVSGAIGKGPSRPLSQAQRRRFTGGRCHRGADVALGLDGSCDIAGQ